MAYDLKKMLGIEDPEEQRRAATVATGGTPVATPFQMPTGAPDAKQGGSGWVNLQRVLGVNQEQGNAMASSLVNPVARAGTALGATPTFGVDPNRVSEAQGVGAAARGLTSFTGRQEMLRGQGQGPNYSAGMARMDSFLADGAGHNALQRTSDMYGGLSDAFGLERQPAPRAPVVDPRHGVTPPIIAEPRGKLYLDDHKRKRRAEGPYGKQEF